MKNLHRAYARQVKYTYARLTHDLRKTDEIYLRKANARQMKYTYTRLTQGLRMIYARLTQGRTGCRELTQIT